MKCSKMLHWTLSRNVVFLWYNEEEQIGRVAGFWEFCVFEFVKILLNYRGHCVQIREI